MKYLQKMVWLWILLLPIVALIEALIAGQGFFFFLVVDAIESAVFWIGLVFAYLIYGKVSLKTYLVLLVIACAAIPLAAIIENAFVQRYSFAFYFFINIIEGVIFLIGMFIGYLLHWYGAFLNSRFGD